MQAPCLAAHSPRWAPAAPARIPSAAPVVGFGHRLPSYQPPVVGSYVAAGYTSPPYSARPLVAAVVGPPQGFGPAHVALANVGMTHGGSTGSRGVMPDNTIAFMPYFAIKQREQFFEACNRCLEAVQNEPLCLAYGFSVSSGPESTVAFCRASFASAEGVLMHLKNIEFLFKEGLCRYGELVSLQIHGPQLELERLRQDRVINELNPEFFELMVGSFEAVELPLPNSQATEPVVSPMGIPLGFPRASPAGPGLVPAPALPGRMPSLYGTGTGWAPELAGQQVPATHCCMAPELAGRMQCGAGGGAVPLSPRLP